MSSDNQSLQEEAAGVSTLPARPAFHFTPPKGWMNDPNGLVYYDGEFHLFYQHNPHGPDFGSMHWGHATTRDFLSWTHLPTALHPDEHGLIYSGSVVVDWNNSSGFGTADDRPLVAVYTYHHPEREKGGQGDHQTQALAYSLDRGRNWTKYSDNPVLGNEKNQPDFRDPKVFWYEPGGQWIKALAAGDHVEFFSSLDLKKWKFLSTFGETLETAGRVWECPDLFPLTAPDGAKKWVLIVSVSPGGPQGGSGTQYFIGNFDGFKFSLDAEFIDFLSMQGTAWLDWGSDNYAGVTWSDIPDEDGRRLFIGWMSNWRYAQNAPTTKWRGAMTAPRTLSLQRIGSTYAVSALPVGEIDRRMEITDALPKESNLSDELAKQFCAPFHPGELRLAAKSVSDKTAAYGVELRNSHGDIARIGYDMAVNQYFCQCAHGSAAAISWVKSEKRHSMPRLADTEVLEMRVLIDHNSAELFADGGLSVLTEALFPSSPFEEVSIFCEHGAVELDSCEIRRFVSG